MARRSPPDDASSGRTGIMWTRDGPVLRMEDAVVEKVVTHTVRTTTSYAPIPLPRVPAPDSIPLPNHLSSESYPLAHEPTPDDMRFLSLDLGGRRVLMQEDGSFLPDNVPGVTAGPGWTRTYPAVNGSEQDRMGLGSYLSKAKGKERKRPHDLSRPSTTGDLSELMEERAPLPRQRSPPRKKARPSDIVLPPGDSSAVLSPIPSPVDDDDTHDDDKDLAPTVGSGLEMAALFSLPAITAHFDLLPDKVQQHVLMHLFRRSKMSTIQRISAFASTALKRDFISLLPHEIAVQILRKIDAKSLANAARVNRKWRRMIDSERGVWKARLVQDNLWYGHGVEEEDEKTIKARFEALDSRSKRRVPRATTPSEDDPMPEEEPSTADERPTALKHIYRRRHVDARNWLHRDPTHTTFPGHGTHVVTCLQFDEDKILSASDDHSINVYDTRTGTLRKRLDGHDGGVWALEYRGDTLVTGSTDRTVRVWDLETLQQSHVFYGHTSTVRCLQIVEPVFDEATGEFQPPYPLIVTGSRDASLRVWKLPKKGEPPYTSRSPAPDPEGMDNPEQNPFHVHHLHGHNGHNGAVRALAAHGRICVSGSYDKTVRVWDIVRGTCLHVLQGHEHKVYSIEYDRYRNRCVSGSMDNTVRVWDIATGTCLHTLTGHTSLVGLLGISPNYIVSAAADAQLRVWDANTNKLKHVLSSHAAAITCFQHDETKVVSGSDGTLKLWDIRTGKFCRDLVTGISGVWQVSFHGNMLVAASNRAGHTVFDVFDFGADADPSGVDDSRLDKLCRQAWERGNPREPHSYQEGEYVSDGDDADMGVQRHSAKSVKRGAGSSKYSRSRARVLTEQLQALQTSPGPNRSSGTASPMPAASGGPRTPTRPISQWRSKRALSGANEGSSLHTNTAASAGATVVGTRSESSGGVSSSNQSSPGLSMSASAASGLGSVDDDGDAEMALDE